MMLARHFDRAFDGFGSGITKEDNVGKTCRAEPLRKLFALRYAIEISDMPKFRRLLGNRADEMRVGVSERVYCYPGREIEIAITIRCNQPRAFATLERKVDARIGRQQITCWGVGVGQDRYSRK